MHSHISVQSKADALIEENTRLRAWLRWIADHDIFECVPPETPYLNMSPSEGAEKALNGESIDEFIE